MWDRFMLRIAALIVLIFSFISAQSQSSKKKELVLFTVGNTPVYTDEFLRLYKKNTINKNDLNSKESAEEYLNLLINFKLKIQEAKARGLDTTETFNNEFKTYLEELKKPYRTEPDALDQLTKQTYKRLKEEINASHILVMVKQDASPEDTLVAFKKISEIRIRVIKGEDFNKVAAEVSEDPSAKYNMGNLGYFTALQMVYPFEEAAYSTKTGEVSPIIRTQFGYHILKVFDRQPARGEVEVSHILLRSSGDDKNTKNKIFEIYDQLKAGRSWDEVCKEFSDDASTKNSGGRLRPFGVGGLSSVPEFERLAFSMNTPGEISDPFQSNIGWHIVRLERKIPLPPYSEMESSLKRRLGRDERLQLSNQAMNQKRRKEFQYKENSESKAKVMMMADSTLTGGAWKYSGLSELLQENLYSLGDKNVKIKEFVQYINTNQKKSSGTPNSYMNQLYDNFVEENIIELENEKLVAENPDFKNLLTEYREGILLFDIMEKEVWNKASIDTVGQRKYYETNKEKYQAGDRVEARIFIVSDRSVIESLISKVNAGDTIGNDDLKKFKSIQPYRTYERKDNKVIDKINWTVGLHETELDGQNYLVEVKRLVAPGIKKFEEARANVISDYQDFLEKEWLSSLRQKFPVKINNKGKKLVLSELTKPK
jgi:peptidyl-prolyl cis-trans isomerase SurA